KDAPNATLVSIHFQLPPSHTGPRQPFVFPRQTSSLRHLPPRCGEIMLSSFPYLLRIPYPLFPYPIPSHCAITVEPWKAPRNACLQWVSPSWHRPPPNPLRRRRASGNQPLGPKIPRGTVPFARRGWSRAAASSFVPSAVITCPARTTISRR